MSTATAAPELDTTAPPTVAAATAWPVKILAVSAVVLLAHARLIYNHCLQLNLKPHYQFYPLIVIGAGVLLWPALAGFARPKGGRPVLALGLVAVSWLTLALGVFFYSATLGLVSLILLLAAVPLAVGGWALLKQCLPALALLLLMIPMPFGLDNKLVGGLQKLTSKAGSSLLDLTGIYHNIRGNVLEVAGKKYFVEEACSGVNSLMSVLACTVFFVLFYRTHWVRAILLILAAVFWVVLANIARVYLITFLDTQFAIDLTSGIPHEILGMALFGLTLGLLWSTDRLILFFARPTAEKLAEKAPPKVDWNAVAAEVTAAPGAWYASPVVASAFGLLLALQIVERVMTASVAPFSGSELSKFYETIDVTTLPKSLGKWEQLTNQFGTRDADNLYGEFSKTWRYAYDKQRPVILSLDYPFPEWHDLRVCYRNNGWVMGVTAQAEIKLGEGEPPLHFVRVPMSDSLGKHGMIWFTNFDQDGHPVKPDELNQELEPSKFADKVYARFALEADHWVKLFQTGKTVGRGGSILQVQLFTESFQPLTEAELKQFEEFFQTSARKLRTKCVDLKAKPAA